MNNIDKEGVITSQMEQWLILSNVINYLQYDRNPKEFYNLDIKDIDQKNHSKIYYILQEVDRHVLNLDFSNSSDKLRGEY